MRAFIVFIIFQLCVSAVSEAQENSQLAAVDSWDFSEMYVTPEGGVFLFDSEDTILWYKNPGESIWNHAWIPNYYPYETFDIGYDYSINKVFPFVQNKMGLLRGYSASDDPFSYCFGPVSMRHIQHEFPLLFYGFHSDTAAFTYISDPEESFWGRTSVLNSKQTDRIYAWLNSHSTASDEEDLPYDVSGFIVNPASLFNPGKPSSTELFKPGVRKYYYDWVRHAFFYKFRDTTFFADSPSHLVIRDSLVYTEIPFHVCSILSDPKSNHVFALSGGNNIYRFFGPDSFIRLNKEPLPADIKSMNVANGSVYLVAGANELYQYQINDSVFKREIMLYDSGPLIPQDSMYYSSGKQYSILNSAVICSEDNGRTWFREKFLPVQCRKQKQLNDSVVLLQYGYRPVCSLYTYCFTTGEFLPYINDNPLGEFLKFPAERIEIELDMCYTHIHEEFVNTSCNQHLVYIYDVNKKVLMLLKDSSQKADYTNFNRQITQEEVTQAIQGINRVPGDSTFDVRELSIDSSDISDYQDLFRNREIRHRVDKCDSSFYFNLPWDSLGLICGEAAVQNESPFGAIFMKIRIVNSAHESIVIGTIYPRHIYSYSWLWPVTYNEFTYSTNSLEFSGFFNSIIPAQSVVELQNTKPQLMLNIADYLYQQKLMSEEKMLR